MAAAKKKSHANDPLSAVRVWDRLEVGPVQVQPQRILAPYRLFFNGGGEATELVFRYEEPVFEPGSPASANLAAMITAQAALNYGLFCGEMRFHGDFDAHDRKFIEHYVEHTAREIYAIKLLGDNPFLTGAASELEPEVRQRYAQAAVTFSGTAHAPAPPPAGDLEEARNRYAVLASGGKDSLLSYGLLRELGLRPQSMFVNESGRHWFSALNAYRHLRDTDPGTARVWTNADRLFTWMVRRMPFVRRDFAEVRADIYPIRLWTVAVFLFGVLPLLRQRGIGRLVIGDEFDTTVRRSLRGITHYDGLFDQSRWFDDAMSRYFGAKSWGTTAFSVLRPCSELLILKTLTERYPDLQAQQMSCHAAHEENGRMVPCGRCEKCRRVVGMLEAVGADPRRCGYSSEQIDACLRGLADKSVKQETEGAEHLLWMLSKQEKIPATVTAHPARRHDEILKLRFHPERSPHEAIPRPLRSRLYPLLLQSADGAVKRSGRSWRRCDPMARSALEAAYPYDPQDLGDASAEQSTASTTGRIAASAADAGADEDRAVLWELLTWPEADRRLGEVDVALLPVGATEQHGPHLTLDTDSYDAARLARDVAHACSEPKPLVLPLIPYGVSYHHEEYAGTLSVTPEALARMVHDIGVSAARNGIKKLVIINGHGGNIPTLHFAAQTVNAEAHIFTCVDTGETSDTDVYALAETPNDVHAGEVETSTSLFLRPETVQMDKARRAVPRFSNPYLDFTSRRSVGWYGRTHKISPSGVMGDPTVATPQKGGRMWGLMIEHLVRLVEDLKRLSLDEIHQNRT